LDLSILHRVNKAVVNIIVGHRAALINFKIIIDIIDILFQLF